MTARQRYNTRPGRSAKWIRKERRLAIMLRDGMCCAYCGTDLRSAAPRAMGLDHLEPQAVCKARGNRTRSGKGVHHEANLVLACRLCNSARKDAPWRSYATPGAVARIMRNRRRKLNMALAKALVTDAATWADALRNAAEEA